MLLGSQESLLEQGSLDRHNLLVLGLERILDKLLGLWDSHILELGLMDSLLELDNLLVLELMGILRNIQQELEQEQVLEQ